MLGGSIRQRYFAPYAHYFLKFLQAYAADGRAGPGSDRAERSGHRSGRPNAGCLFGRRNTKLDS